jgi:hypothetical protein
MWLIAKTILSDREEQHFCREQQAHTPICQPMSVVAHGPSPLLWIESNIMGFSVVADPLWFSANGRSLAISLKVLLGRFSLEDYRLLFLLPFLREACCRSALPGYLFCLVVGALAAVLRQQSLLPTSLKQGSCPLHKKEERDVIMLGMNELERLLRLHWMKKVLRAT